MMPPTRRSLPALALGLLIALTCAAAPAAASVLMFDFGPTVVTGADQGVSPYHAVNPSFTGTAWNQVQTTAITSGLKYADGTDATGVTIAVGRSSSLGWQTLTFAGAPASATLGTGSNTGVFSGSSVGKDAIDYGSSSSTNSVVGVAIGGLSPGTYDVYIVGYNTNDTTSAGATMGFWAVGTASTANLDTTSSLSSPQATSTNSVVSSWIAGENYVKLTVTLTSSDHYLTLYTHGTTDNEMRGFLNAVQIVSTSSIPEPATSAALAGLGILALAAIARARRHRGA